MDTNDYAKITSWLKEAFDLMTELEDKFMYHSGNLQNAEEVILEATQLYFDTMKFLNDKEDYEHYDEFNTKFRDSYAFITSNYFRFKIESLKEGK